MKIYKAYVFRMYPNNKEKELINKSLGVSRFIYNYFLSFKKDEYEKNKNKYTSFDLIKMLPKLNEEYPFLKEVDSCLLRTSIFNLEDAFNRFYKGNGYPRFKRKGAKDSYKTNNIKSSYKGKSYNSIELDLKNRTIKLPKLGIVAIRGYRNIDSIDGNIKSAVIRKTANKYYVSVLVEEEHLIKEEIHKSIVGIDLGIKDMVITSTGEKLNNENKDRLERLKKRLKGLQKALSRSMKGSNNRYKLIIKIERLYEKINNIKKHTINNIVNKIIKKYDIVCLETLNIKKMYENHNIAKRLVDIPLYKLIERFVWKGKLLGKKIIEIDKCYPSSRECSRCGCINEEVKDLSIRKWECPSCRSIHDRDINASINIMFKGLEKYIKEQYV